MPIPPIAASDISMEMTKKRQIWKSLRDKEYRTAFAADVSTGLAFQIRLLREKMGWTQEELARRTGKRQETISQCENPNYGRYTLVTLKELAAAFDVALVVKFTPFSELVDWIAHLTPDRLAPVSFDEEYESVVASMQPHQDIKIVTSSSGDIGVPVADASLGWSAEETLPQREAGRLGNGMHWDTEDSPSPLARLSNLAIAV